MLERALDRVLFGAADSIIDSKDWVLLLALGAIFFLPASAATLTASPGWRFLFVVLLTIFGVMLIMGIAVRGGDRRMAKLRLRLCRNLQAVRGLKWGDFEAFTADLLAAEGYEVEVRGGEKPDGGIDHVARKDGKSYAVQCKQYRDEKIGVELVRQLVGAMHTEKLEGAIYVTSGEFTDPVRTEFGAGNVVRLIDGAAIAERLEVTGAGLDEAPEEADSLFARLMERQARQVEAHGRIVRIPKCPKCGSEMVLRHSPKNAQNFWGCSKYSAAPSCQGQRSLSADEVRTLDPQRKHS